MINKKDQSDPIDNLEYEKVLEEEIINSYESKFQKDSEPVKNKTKFYRLKRKSIRNIKIGLFFFFLYWKFYFLFVFSLFRK